MNEPHPDNLGGYHRPDRNASMSVRQRRRIGAWALALSLAAVALLAFAPDALRLIEPAPRTFAHASIGDCGTCHGSVGADGLAWLHAAFDGADSSVGNERCLSCHDLGPNPGMAHGVAPETLAAITAAQPAPAGTPPVLSMLARAILGTPGSADAELACTTCHREHHDGDFALGAMADDTCQACHQAPFASLADGHPAFDDYPGDDIIRLHFSHESHIGHHFPGDDDAPRTCDACHQADRAGRMMLVADFKSACESCHLSDIVNDIGRRPMVAFALPRADLAGLEAAGHRTGSWPAVADQPLAPFVRWMLAHDPDTADALERLPDGDLARADLSDPQTASDVATVLWAVKALVRDVRDRGPAVIVDLINAGATGIRHTHMQRLVQDLRLDRIAEHADAWFPELDHELALHAAGRDDALAPIIAVAGVDPGDLGPLLDGAAPRSWERSQGVVWSDAGAVYWPVDHADTVLTFLLGLPGRHGESRQLMDSLESPAQAGSCILCHVFEPSSSLAMEHAVDDTPPARDPWQVQAPAERLHDFTRFAHAPHLAVALEDGCLTCHRPEQHDATAMGGRDFAELDREVCLTCHAPENAPATCTTCHGYHVGHASLVASDTPLEGAVPDTSDGHED